MRTLVLLLILLLQTSRFFGQTLNVHISGIRNNSGVIQLVFYTTSESFEKEKPMLTKIIPKTGMVNGTLSASYTGLKPGTYGVAILDDENTNQKMDYGLILPKEGFGFSDYYHTGMSRPKFAQFSFILGTADKTVQIRIRYL